MYKCFKNPKHNRFREYLEIFNLVASNGDSLREITFEDAAVTMVKCYECDAVVKGYEDE